MGLFHSGDKFPEPRVTLQLDTDCKPTFHPGAKVFGQVFFDSSVPRQIRNVEVLIEGSALTKYARRILRNGTTTRVVRYHDESGLLAIKQTLVEGMTAESKKRYCWNFSIAFPTGEGALLHPHPAISPYKSTSGYSQFYASESYQLPPSFLYAKNGQEDMAQVQYILKVLVTFDDHKTPYSPPFKILQYAPCQPPPEPVPFYENTAFLNRYKSYTLTANSMKPGFKKFMYQLCKIDAPLMRLCLRCTAPSKIVRGRPFPIAAEVLITPFTDFSVVDTPTVKIKVVSMELLPTVIYRCLKVASNWEDVELPVNPAEEELIGEMKAVGLNAAPQELEVEQQRDEAENTIAFPATFKGRSPADVTPSFETSNIILWYKLRVKATGYIYGTTITQEIEQKIQVLTDVKASSCQ